MEWNRSSISYTYDSASVVTIVHVITNYSSEWNVVKLQNRIKAYKNASVLLELFQVSNLRVKAYPYGCSVVFMGILKNVVVWLNVEQKKISNLLLFLERFGIS